LKSKKQILKIRKTSVGDLKKINDILLKTYPEMVGYSEASLTSQIKIFPEGQFIIENADGIVGFCITLIVNKSDVMKQHTWKEITDNGRLLRHDPNGEYLYGVDICVDPDFRGSRIGSRLYDERKKLCQNLGLLGIVFGARMPGFSKKIKQYPTAEKYLEAVNSKKIKDQTLSFQIKNGFEPLFVLKNYLEMDLESFGYAVMMKWRNPLVEKIENVRIKYFEDEKDNVKICTINFEQRRIDSFLDFKNILYYFIEVAVTYGCDFVVFPEFVTMTLLSIENKKISAMESLEKLGEYTKDYIALLNDAAVKFNINIIGGTHISKDSNNKTQNICYVFLRDGSIHQQAKLHPTPSEKEWGDIQGGDKLSVIHTDKCPIGILICYDSEFPELARILADQGAKIIFVPFSTDTRQGYLRVRYSCMARAIENQCYVVMSGNTGNLPRVHNMDINYGQSAILTPSDFAFARDGIAAETDVNTEAVAIAELSITDLVKARNNGTVRNLRDRRSDLYKVVWTGKV
jgi:predicted amidohydrolase/GNAT superfamily N-acetyltransferase